MWVHRQRHDHIRYEAYINFSQASLCNTLTRTITLKIYRCKILSMWNSYFKCVLNTEVHAELQLGYEEKNNFFGQNKNGG